MPDAILFKAERLTRNEMELVMRHTVIGHSMLNVSSNPYYKRAAAISLTHHERFNGRGYPFGLSGHAIPVDGRITSLAMFSMPSLRTGLIKKPGATRKRSPLSAITIICFLILR